MVRMQPLKAVKTEKATAAPTVRKPLKLKAVKPERASTAPTTRAPAHVKPVDPIEPRSAPLSQQALVKTLIANPVGPLQIKIMHCLWERGASTAIEVHAWVSAQRAGESPLAKTTILTVLRNLWLRGLTDRMRQGKSDRYHASVDERRFKRTVLAVLCAQVWRGDVEAMERMAIQP